MEKHPAPGLPQPQDAPWPASSRTAPAGKAWFSQASPLRVCVMHPDDERSRLLIQQLQYLGCQVQALWPPRQQLPLATEVVFLAMHPQTLPQHLGWAHAEQAPALIAMPGEENASALSGMLALKALAVLPAAASAFELLSCLLVACETHKQARKQQARIDRLQAKLLGQRHVIEAKKVLMHSLQIDEGQAYELIREQAMRKRCTVESMAETIVSASVLLSPAAQAARSARAE
ncbi:ANTAR domain-containing response regulator [Comamonas composti]|uniref:ANTAR domain-containing response regulator n=1 Tax=Comamonas composti TaxID=408558 RepID=UPI000400EF05|nr:ANTAR domain-containing protein [Comamonas composti]